MEESFKELGRVILLAIIPVVISSVEMGEIDFKVIGTIGLLAALRFADKLLHQVGKENDNKFFIKGITRF